MKFEIIPEIFAKFPGLHIGLVIARGMDNRGSADDIQSQLCHEEERIRRAYAVETLSQDPRIESWRRAYAAFGAKPKEHRSSVENLYRMVLGGAAIRRINPLVDAYNLVSLRHMLPVGGEDLDRISGDLVLAFAEKDEPVVLLLGDKEPRPPHEGEVIYKDDVSAICRRWNWRESERAKLTAETRNAVLAIEALPPVGRQELSRATEDLAQLIQRFCGGGVRQGVLDERERMIRW